MDVGFDLELKESDMVTIRQWRKYANDYKNSNLDKKVNIEKFLTDRGALDGEVLKREFFPTVRKVDVFISYSHNDEDNALAIAGWLKAEYNIEVFLDANVWRSAVNLLKDIDDEHCVMKYDEQGNSKTYDYKRRNLSTACVYLLLNSALMEMIDKCRCLVFLNTKHSILDGVGIEDGDMKKTESPWIYSELLMSKLLKRKTMYEKLGSLVEDSKLFSMEFDANLEHLKKLSLQKLVKICDEGYMGDKVVDCLCKYGR